MKQQIARLVRGLTAKPASPSRGDKRLLALAAIIGVPAFAAPADWSAASESATHAALEAPQAELMPFETAGQSFPGSAFYYLEDAPELALALPTIDPTEKPAAPGELGRVLDHGPAARAFLSTATGMDKARAQRCMAQAIYYEAASESEAGQKAVAQVVLNRVAHSAWPNSVCGVVFEGSTRRTGCQFSFTCDGSMARKPGRAAWDRAQRIAARALSGEVYEPVGLATHYHTNWVNPYWAKSLDHIGTIGAHRFYRWRGANGRPAAFQARYAGIETTYRANLTGPVTGSAPIGSAAAYAPLPASVPATAEATTSADRIVDLPKSGPVASTAHMGAGQIREEYANVGKWLDQPGKAATAPGQ